MVKWLKYFLVGIEQTAAQAVTTRSKVLELKNEIEGKIQIDLGRRSHTGLKLMQHLFVHPVITIAKPKKSVDYAKKLPMN